MSAVNVCPKCGHVPPGDQAGLEECPACGIVHAKFLAARARREAAGADDVDASRKDGRPLPLSTVSYLTLMAGVALLTARALYKPLPLLWVLLIVPFYFIGVGALSWFVSGGVYCWDKWKGEFEFLDAKEHPVKCFITMVVCVAGCLGLVFFMFYIPEQ